MTKAELKTLKAGDIISDKKYGFKFELVKVCTYNTAFNGKVIDLMLIPVDGQNYKGLYTFEKGYTYINSKRMNKL